MAPTLLASPLGMPDPRRRPIVASLVVCAGLFAALQSSPFLDPSGKERADQYRRFTEETSRELPPARNGYAMISLTTLPWTSVKR